MVTPLSFHAPSDWMNPSWYFTCLGVVSKWPFNFNTPFSSIFGLLIGNHPLCDHGVEHRVLVDQVLEDGFQLLGRKLIAERL